MRQLPPSVKKLLFIPPIIVGGLLLFYMASSRKAPERKPEIEVARALRVIQAPELEILPRSLGYGTAEPGRVWTAVTEVKGRVVKVHPDLSPGAIIKQGQLVVQVDPQEYDLAIARNQAELQKLQAQRDELAQKQQNNESSLTIERKSLNLAEKELARLKELSSMNAAADSAVEQQERAVLMQKQSVQSLEITIRLMPVELKA